MGNLMNERNQMSSLYSKYQGFLTPAAKILVGDSDRDLVESSGAQVENLSVSLSLDTTASASFSLINVYDFEKSSFMNSVMDQLQLGNRIKIELGYGSSLEKVFTGFIYSVKADFGDMASLSVTALDVRRVMEDAMRRSVVWKYTTYSDIFRKVMEPYKKLYSKLIVDDTPANEVVSMMQNESDLTFVKRLAKEGNREFFVYDDIVYFRRKAKRSPSVTLTWGQDLISFTKESIYSNQKVIVMGLLKDSKDTVTASAEVKTDSSTKQVAAGGLVYDVVSPTSDTQQKAAEKAARLAEEMRKKKQSGQGSCTGLPQLLPGRPVAVAGLSSQINGTYMLKNVTHNFGGDGFQTQFEIGGFD
ncbi:MAG: phage late control D family protein [Acetatifactor sp.]|nr:phage late control D family protein [Acetatifactor sp.]